MACLKKLDHILVDAGFLAGAIQALGNEMTLLILQFTNLLGHDLPEPCTDATQQQGLEIEND